MHGPNETSQQSSMLQPLPVIGYSAQSPESVEFVNEGKALEGRVLLWLERVQARARSVSMRDGEDPPARAAAEAKTCIQTGFMWAFRSVFRPIQATEPGPLPATTPTSER